MNPILAALIPTLVLGIVIILLLKHSRDCRKKIAALKRESAEPPPKIIKRNVSQAPFLVKDNSQSRDTDEPELEKNSTTDFAYFNSSASLLATLSHELKTPLNGIMGITQILREEDEDARHLIELEGCATHMHSVLHTLTNLARIQNKNEYLPQYREWVSLRDVIEQVKEDTTFRAIGRRLNIKLVHANNRLRLRGDQDHIETIIKSVLLGSIESVPLENLPSRPNDLTIAWETKGEQIEFLIDNPNESIEPERDQSIAEILNLARGRARSRVKVQYLHLAVAQSLLDFYKGSIEVTELELGGARTKMVFTMEQMMASPSDARPLGGLRVQGGKSGIKTLRDLPETMRILVAEDDEVSRDLLLHLLARMGQETVSVENGEKAVLTLQQDSAFDLILMDVDMPVMDGMAATEAIRNGLASDEVKDIPIAAVTAFNVISDRSRFKEAGMNYFLRKPVDLKELRATLLEVVKKKKVM